MPILKQRSKAIRKPTWINACYTNVFTIHFAVHYANYWDKHFGTLNRKIQKQIRALYSLRQRANRLFCTVWSYHEGI